MSAVINNLSAVRTSIAECNEQIVLFNGHDRPRYYSPLRDVSGYLGLEDWSNYWQKAVGTAKTTGGSLEDDWYSIKLVPVNADVTALGTLIQGNFSAASQPVQVAGGGGSGSVEFASVPLHPQKKAHVCSKATANGTTTLTDSAQSWSTNEWAGYTVLNVENGNTATISSNTGSVLTLDANIATTDDDRYQIQSPEATARYVYASKGASAALALSGTYYFVGIITDNTTETYTLTTYVATADVFVGDMYAPPNAFTCFNAGDVLVAGGGIEVEGETGNTAEYNGTTEEWDASTDGAVAVTVSDDDYASAGTSQILRFTAGSAMFTDIYVGSYVTIAGSENAGENDTSDARVLRVDTAKKWFEILNNDGVANASDTSMTITMTPNIIEGTGTSFAEGMVDAQFEFTTDNSGAYVISWVDSVNQKIGLASKYAGNNAATTADYRIHSSYELYYSDLKNPHRWRTISVVEVGDTIKGLYALGRFIVIFCTNSIWRWNLLEPGESPELVNNSVYFDATWSICSNGKMVLFYDGEGISITDGLDVQSVTALKGRNYLNNVNKSRANQIQGIYNPLDRRYEFSMPMGTETNNNYGLYITENNFDNIPVSRVDANALFTGYENGRFMVYHGTSGDYQGGTGTVWTHEGVTDGLTGTAYETTITGISGQVVTVQGTEEITWSAGDIVTFYPAGNGSYRQCMIESITDNGDYEYELTFATGVDVSDYDEDDLVLYGMIPFDYGIKWDDFKSPQYLKRVHEVHIDLYGMTGRFFIDHYKDLDESSAQNNSQTVTSTDSKLVFRFRAGKVYIYGFRLRGYSSTEFKINAIEKIFSVIR